MEAVDDQSHYRSTSAAQPPLLRGTTCSETIDRLIAWIRNQLRIRRDTHQLLADDRLLADIGLTREQAERATRPGGSPPTGG
jgi:uncharacterized protein YjiS (DUF1127 family)